MSHHWTIRLEMVQSVGVSLVEEVSEKRADVSGFALSSKPAKKKKISAFDQI